MHKRPRQTDVAKLAGVSPATVSVILNNRLAGNVRISAETQARVLAAVEQLGYVTNPIARSLAGGQNSLLGVFTVEPIFPRQQSDIYHPFLMGIEQEAGLHGYNLLLFTSASPGEGPRYIYQGNINRLHMADGAILLGPAQSKAELQRLVADHYPFVLVGQHTLPNEAFTSVAADYISATAKIVTEMLSYGHRHIAYLCAASDHDAHPDCYTGYLIAHRQARLNSLVTPAEPLTVPQITPAFLQQTLARGITAFVIESADSLSAAFVQAMSALNKSAPADFSLAFLGDPTTDFVAPYPITRFTIPREEMGRRAVQLLTELLRAPQSPPRQETLACTYTKGVTIAPPGHFAPLI